MLIIKAGNNIHIKHEKHIVKEIRGKTFKVLSVGTSIVVSLEGVYRNIQKSEIQNIIPSVGDTVRLGDGKHIKVVKVLPFVFSGEDNIDHTHETIIEIMEPSPFIRFTVGQIVFPNTEEHTRLPRLIDTVNGDELTFEGLIGSYYMRDFVLSEHPISKDIRLYNENGRKQLLHHTMPLKDYLKDEYAIIFEDLNRVLNNNEPLGLQHTTIYPKIITIKSGDTLSSDGDRVKELIDYINRVIIET